MRGRRYCPECREWREVAISVRSHDGTVSPCRKHLVTRRPDIGRRHVDANGYVRLRVAPGRSGVVYEHRWVWEQAFGAIPPGHHVHHVNHDRSDNRIGNLQLIDARTHLSAHSVDKHRTGVINNRGSASVRYRTDIDDEAVVALRAEGLGWREIGRQLGIHHNVARNHHARAVE